MHGMLRIFNALAPSAYDAMMNSTDGCFRCSSSIGRMQKHSLIYSVVESEKQMPFHCDLEHGKHFQRVQHRDHSGHSTDIHKARFPVTVKHRGEVNTFGVHTTRNQ